MNINSTTQAGCYNLIYLYIAKSKIVNFTKIKNNTNAELKNGVRVDLLVILLFTL